MKREIKTLFLWVYDTIPYCKRIILESLSLFYKILFNSIGGPADDMSLKWISLRLNLCSQQEIKVKSCCLENMSLYTC